MPTCAFDFTGRVREIHNRHVKIEKQLSEHLDDQSGQRHVLALARYLDTDEEIMLKIRYDLNPEQFDIEDLKESREDADMMFLHEADGVENVYAIHHGPRYITYVTQPAGQEMPYPDGWADFLITSRVPGDDVAEISGELTFDQLESIRKQLANILEDISLFPWLFITSEVLLIALFYPLAAKWKGLLYTGSGHSTIRRPK
ncbi:hypothetical protein AWENTII_007009 [Aspergillus wentii]